MADNAATGDAGGDTHRAPAGARRVFVVGYDGATLKLIEPWVREGRLPNLAQLMEAGAYGPLASTIPPISAPAWTSFMTGVNPGKHGIYEFQAHEPGTYNARLVNGADVRAPTLWRILSDAGKHSIAVNVAMTYPPEQVSGIVISGVDAPGNDSGYTQPAEIEAELRAAIGHYVIEPGMVEHCRRGNYAAAFDSLMDALEQRFKAVDYLMQKKPWDLFVVNYRATDNVQHHFWHLMDPSHPLHNAEQAREQGDAIFKIYERLDQWLGTLMERLDDDTVLVLVSDHGAGPASAKAVYFNRWLQQQGWLVFAGQQGSDLGGRLKAGAMALAWKVVWGYLRQWTGKRTKDALRRRFPTLFARARTPAAYFSIDWDATKAYSDEFREVVWINLKGREPKGIVEPGAEYEALRTEIVRRLQEMVDPLTGKRVVEHVWRREEIYSGPHLEEAPDLLMQLCQEPYYRTRLSHTAHEPAPVQTLSRERMQADFLPPGLHRSDGIVFVAGEGIRSGMRIAGARIIDVAPTVLHILGMPVPRYMDGRVLTEIMERPGAVRYTADQSEAQAPRSYSADEEAAVREKLAGLGYLG